MPPQKILKVRVSEMPYQVVDSKQNTRKTEALIFVENRKARPEYKKPQTAKDIKTEKPSLFLVQNRKTDEKNCQNRKNENPNALLLKVYAHDEYFELGHFGKYAHGSIWAQRSYKRSILIFFNSRFGSLQLACCELVRCLPSMGDVLVISNIFVLMYM